MVWWVKCKKLFLVLFVSFWFGWFYLMSLFFLLRQTEYQPRVVHDNPFLSITALQFYRNVCTSDGRLMKVPEQTDQIKDLTQVDSFSHFGTFFYVFLLLLLWRWTFLFRLILDFLIWLTFFPSLTLFDPLLFYHDLSLSFLSFQCMKSWEPLFPCFLGWLLLRVSLIIDHTFLPAVGCQSSQIFQSLSLKQGCSWGAPEQDQTH